MQCNEACKELDFSMSFLPKKSVISDCTVRLTKAPFRQTDSSSILSPRVVDLWTQKKRMRSTEAEINMADGLHLPIAEESYAFFKGTLVAFLLPTCFRIINLNFFLFRWCIILIFGECMFEFAQGQRSV